MWSTVFFPWQRNDQRSFRQSRPHDEYTLITPHYGVLDWQQPLLARVSNFYLPQHGNLPCKHKFVREFHWCPLTAHCVVEILYFWVSWMLLVYIWVYLHPLHEQRISFCLWMTFFPVLFYLAVRVFLSVNPTTWISVNFLCPDHRWRSFRCAVFLIYVVLLWWSYKCITVLIEWLGIDTRRYRRLRVGCWRSVRRHGLATSLLLIVSVYLGLQLSVKLHRLFKRWFWRNPSSGRSIPIIVITVRHATVRPVCSLVTIRSTIVRPVRGLVRGPTGGRGRYVDGVPIRGRVLGR